MALNQLRFRRGKPKPSDSATAALEKSLLEREEALVYDEEGNPIKARIDKDSIGLSVSLRGADSSEIVAYKAKQNAPLVDLANINHYDPVDFWETHYESGKKGLILEAGDFYILASKERVQARQLGRLKWCRWRRGYGRVSHSLRGIFRPGIWLWCRRSTWNTGSSRGSSA